MKHEPPSTRQRQSPPAPGGAPAQPLTIVIVNRQRRHALCKRDLARVLQGTASFLNVTGELALVFAGDTLLRRLNREFRSKDKPTDVLSFPAQDREMGLGDIIISVETAQANAVRFSRPLDRELEILALHGFLHLLGYDHETDTGQMDAIEKKLRARYLTRRVAA